jgi:tetratricopeptide (TPR) repeat protein
MSENEYEKQIDQAFQFNQSGRNQEAIAVLSKVFGDIPASDIKALGLVGSLLREANELSKALYCFQLAVESDPASERSSLGLFHTLWRLERYDEGFDELRRFLSISESEEHFRLLEEMRDSLDENDNSHVNDPERAR